jgi:hypothetical protein
MIRAMRETQFRGYAKLSRKRFYPLDLRFLSIFGAP